MQHVILSKSSAADSVNQPKAPVEQLVWMGTAYGRRHARDKTKPAPTSPRPGDGNNAFSPRLSVKRLAVKVAYRMRALRTKAAAYQLRSYQPAILALLAVGAAVAAAALVQSFVPDDGLPQTVMATNPANDTIAAPRRDLADTAVASNINAVVAAAPVAVPIPEPVPIAVTVEAPAAEAATNAPLEHAAASAAAEAAAVQSKLAIESERTARLQAEEKAMQLSSQLAAHKAGRDSAETAAAEMKALLETERKARAEAELAARTAQDELNRKVAAQAVAATSSEPQEARVAMSAPELAGAPVTSATHPQLRAETRPETRENAPRAHVISPPPANMSKNSSLTTEAMREGQKLFTKGELSAARQQFEKAAIAGLPEGALALGATFDPVALGKAGFKQGGDPARAREWYRRAHELALTQSQPHRQAHRVEPATQSNLQIPRLE